MQVQSLGINNRNNNKYKINGGNQPKLPHNSENVSFKGFYNGMSPREKVRAVGALTMLIGGCAAAITAFAATIAGLYYVWGKTIDWVVNTDEQPLTCCCKDSSNPESKNNIENNTISAEAFMQKAKELSVAEKNCKNKECSNNVAQKTETQIDSVDEKEEHEEVSPLALLIAFPVGIILSLLVCATDRRLPRSLE